MEDFKVIQTQEEFDERIKERLDREKEKYAKKIAELEAFKTKSEETDLKIAELSKSLEGLETTTKENAELKTKIAKYESDSVKTRIAHEFDIPYELAGRLNGSNEDEIRKDAQAISGFLKKKGPVAPAAQAEEKVTKESNYKKMAQALFNGGE